MKYFILDICDTKGHCFTHLYACYISRKLPDMMDVAKRCVPDAKSVKTTEVAEEVVFAFGRMGRTELPPDWQPKTKAKKSPKG
jgi:hypothetical protein